MTAMRYHERIFGWMMSAGHLNTFNDLTKSSIELDDGKPILSFHLTPTIACTFQSTS